MSLSADVGDCVRLSELEEAKIEAVGAPHVQQSAAGLFRLWAAREGDRRDWRRWPSRWGWAASTVRSLDLDGTAATAANHATDPSTKRSTESGQRQDWIEVPVSALVSEELFT